MTIVQVIATLGSIPLFAMRTFLPAFLTGIFLTYPNLFPGMEDVPQISEGSYLTRIWVLVILGILSALEIIGDKVPEIKNGIKDVEVYLKPASLLLVGLGLVDNSTAQILHEVQWAGFDPMWIVFGFSMLAVYWLATIRRDFITFLEDIDEDDNMFIGRFTSWMEDSLVIFGFILLVWAGILMVVVYASAIALFVFIRKRYEKKLEEQKIECAHCGERNLPFAVKCYSCKKPQAQVHGIGFFGQKKEELIYNIQKHQLKLISNRKCPDCGNKLKSNKVFQSCDHCSTELFQSPSIKDFTKSIDRKFYKIAGLSFLLGFIPVAGFVISAILANIYLFSPYRRYIPKGSSLMTKLFIKFLTFMFFLFGIAFGFIAAPVYCIMRYYIWKGKFKERAVPTRSVTAKVV